MSIPFTLRVAKTHWSFGHCGCNRVKKTQGLPDPELAAKKIMVIKLYRFSIFGASPYMDIAGSPADSN